MAKRKAKQSVRKAKTARKPAAPRRSAQRKKAGSPTRTAARKSPRRAARPKKSKSTRRAARPAPRKTPRLDRARRTLSDTVQTPPSSLNMDRHASAARTGRAEMQQSREVHGAMTTAITGGDVDVNLEQAYFSGDEAPGGDNPTPDQDVVDDLGRALGVEYQDNEELRASDKVAARDKKRWELDPASSEDYKERK